MQAVHRFATVFLLVLLPGGLVGPATFAADDLHEFASKKGGYRLQIPKSWHRTEISQRGYYEAALSREKVQTEEDVYTYGVSIVRFADYRRVFPFDETDPQTIAQQFANRLAGQHVGIGETTVMPIDGVDRGVATSEFEIVAFEETPECLYFRLVVAVKGTTWFHAQWEIPCRERSAKSDELRTMVDSLTISKSW